MLVVADGAANGAPETRVRIEAATHAALPNRWQILGPGQDGSFFGLRVSPVEARGGGGRRERVPISEFRLRWLGRQRRPQSQPLALPIFTVFYRYPGFSSGGPSGKKPPNDPTGPELTEPEDKDQSQPGRDAGTKCKTSMKYILVNPKPRRTAQAGFWGS